MKISVISAVYNSEAYLREAVESVLNQRFRDFEWIIVNDCSTDNSIAIIESYQDPRIRILHNEKNQGLAASLNKAIQHSQGEYLLRMDTDDICRPDRFEKQVAFMEQHPEISIAGSWVQLFGEWKGTWKTARTYEEIKVRLLFNSALAHPSVIMRRKDMLENGLTYNEELRKAQDYDLWVRAAEKVKLANIPEVLLEYRLLPSEKTKEVVIYANRIIYATRDRQLARLGIVLNDQEKDQLHYITSNKLKSCDPKIASSILKRILESNREKKIYDAHALQKILGKLWLHVCIKKPSAFLYTNAALLKTLPHIAG